MRCTSDWSTEEWCTARQTVVIDDVTPPAVPVLASVTGECGATVTAPTTTDTCAGTITGTTGDPLVYSTQGTFTIQGRTNGVKGKRRDGHTQEVSDDATT